MKISHLVAIIIGGMLLGIAYILNDALIAKQERLTSQVPQIVPMAYFKDKRGNCYATPAVSGTSGITWLHCEQAGL